MTDTPALERLLRRDRAATAAALLVVVAAGWLFLLRGTGLDMSAMDGPPSWSPGHAALMLAMWAVMMAAMMLPSAAPMILFYGSIARRRRAQGGIAAATGFFVAGYVAVWSAFGAGAVVLQYLLAEAALLSPTMHSTSTALAGLLLIGAGLWQWTPLKDACLRHCRSPLDFVLSFWREGRGGAFRMGLRHGAYCLGCCWVLMLLLFVGGVMNPAWIAGLALYVLLEKVVPAGRRVGRLAGLVLVAWGGAVLSGAV